MGLLTLGRMFDSNRHDVIDDQIDVVGRGFLGLSISCARCHDHKYDPVPTADYYSLYGVFASCVEPYDRAAHRADHRSGKGIRERVRGEAQGSHRQATGPLRRDAQDRPRAHAGDYLVHVATTEPDVSETTIFFLSLIPDQLRPRMRKLAATLRPAGVCRGTVFGP